MTTMRSPAASRAALPPAVPGEFIPRRDHAVRLFWIALPGMLPALGAGEFDWSYDFGVYLAVFVLVGAAVGVAQGVFCWRGTVPWGRWVPVTALGWVTGAISGALLGVGLAFVLRAAGIELVGQAPTQLALFAAGAGAGWNAASLQAMLLRRQGREWKWWVYASAGAAAFAAVLPWVFFPLGSCGW